jgi:UDP-N-acetyl-2-amino-2-deoxyglucuronate dehydrogenase
VGTDRSPAPGAAGLIGLGEIGQVHAGAVRQSRAARLVAVADIAPDLLAPFQAQGIRGYRNAGELIADAEVGTVSVCLPHYLHFPVTLEAIRAGGHPGFRVRRPGPHRG